MGTVKSLVSNVEALVVWDDGEEDKYRYSVQHDLLIVEIASTGAKHKDIKCKACERSIAGIRWKCSKCGDYTLCSQCYHGGNHELKHCFLRILGANSSGELMTPRLNSPQFLLNGMFVGAEVVSGKDWQWNDQDGGNGAKGFISGFTDYGATVEWGNGNVNYYRIGEDGMIDLKCVTAVDGHHVYADHLPLFGETIFQKLKRTS